jgi:hypothetical protein
MFWQNLLEKFMISTRKLRHYRINFIEWSCLFLGLLLIFRYRWLIDDSFIYFRYIDNFLFLKIGLVYNQGEFVEGFSSPAWLILLSFFRMFHINFWMIVQIIGGLSFVLFWILLIKLNRKLCSGHTIINFPLIFIASNYGVLCYFTSGLETPLVLILAITYALYILNPSSKLLQVMLAFSPLVRHELILPLIICFIWGWFREKRFPKLLFILTAIFVGSWEIFRIYYYADLFPNTFYLKNTVDIKQGLVYLHETLSTYHFYPIAIIFIVISLYLTFKKKDKDYKLKERLIIVLAALSVTLYVVKIGGDPRHYRFLAFPFCLAVCSFGGIIERLISNLKIYSKKKAFLFSGALYAIFFLSYPPQLSIHPITLKESHKMVNKINDASIHRHRPVLKYANWRKKVNIQKMLKYKELHPEYIHMDTLEANRCVDIYTFFDKRVIHSLGLTDAFLARTEVQADRPAHKFGLIYLAQDIVYIYDSAKIISKGMFRKAAEQGKAPQWILKNFKSIESIEKKIFNNHNFVENLWIALTFPKKIIP